MSNITDLFLNVTQPLAQIPLHVPLHVPLLIMNGTHLANKTVKAAKAAALTYPPLFSAQYLPATTIACLILTWICSSAGIGGAALDSVVFILVMGLVPKQVSPLTKALVFGEALGGYLINCRRSHPFMKRPLINYEVATAFEPFSLLGTLWGVYANQSFPSYIILAGLIIVLSFAFYRTALRGYRLFRAERENAEGSESQTTTVSVGEEEVDVDEEPDTNGVKLKKSQKGQNGEKDEKDEKEKKDVEEPAEPVVPEDNQIRDWAWFTGERSGIKYFPRVIYLLLFSNWTILVLFDALIVSATLGVVCNSAEYWGTLFLTVPLFFAIAFAVAWFLHRKYKIRRENKYEYTVADLKWTWKRLAAFMFTSLATGILAAMFGLGGGTLNSPALLELGLIPAQVPATSGLMILLTGSVAIVQYLALGRITYDYLLWFIFIGFIGGVSGHLGIRAYIKKYRKQSAIVFLLASLVFAGLVVLLYTVSILFVEGTAVMTIASPCSS